MFPLIIKLDGVEKKNMERLGYVTKLQRIIKWHYQ